MVDITGPVGGQGVNDSVVWGDVIQIAHARVVNIGGHSARGPLPDAASTPAPPGLSRIPRRQARVFVGREQELERVEQALRGGRGVITQAPQAAVYGLGGIGKSELALQYALRCSDRYHLVWWIDADSPAQIQDGLASLARAIIAGKSSVAADQATAQEAVDWGVAWLAAHPGWLLIFDNVEEVGDIEPVLGRLTGGHVLITTRRATGWDGLCKSINLEVLDADAAVRLLAELIGDVRPASSGELAALAEELGWLPLALTQAGAYIAHTARMTVDRYRRLLREAPGRLYAAAIGYDPDRVVARVWDVTIDRIAQINPLAPRLMKLLACYAPDFLPIDVLYGLPDASELDIDEALGLLASYSMISLGQDTVSVHRLVQSVTLARLTADQQDELRRLAADLLASALPEDPDRFENWPAYARLAPHARVALSPGSPAMARVIDYLGASGDYASAKELQHQRYLALSSALGLEHPDTLTARHSLARWMGAAGDVAGARDLFAEVLAVRERVLGLEHPDTLATRHELAYWMGAAGDVAGARDLFAEVLAVRERVLGLEHPDTLTTRHNLASWMGEAGDVAGARDLFAEVLAVRERVLGPEHPSTLATRHNLARWMGEAGDVDGARDLLAQVLAIEERVLGPEHPDTLTTRHNLASWMGEAGDVAGARDLFAEVLAVRERVLGPEHPSTLATRHNLARWLGEAGDVDGARDLFAEVLAIEERVLGPEHPDTLTTRNNLAYWMGEAGDVDGARDLLAQVLAIAERVLGPEHPSTLATRHNLAYWMGEAGDAAGARDLLAQVLAVRERVLGPEHPSTLATRHNLAYWMGEAGDAAGARDLLAQVLAVRERVLGPEHPSTLATRHNLAYWMGEAGDAAGARDLLAQVLAVRERVLGPEHPSTLATRHNLAYWMGEAGDVDGARDLFAEVLAIEERVLGPEHPSTLTRRKSLLYYTKRAHKRR